MIIEEYFTNTIPNDKSDIRYQIWNFYARYYELIFSSKGSKSKHQAWEGGYIDHLLQCFEIADRLYHSLPNLPFTFSDTLIVLHLHDIEKIWKYTDGSTIDKERVLSEFSLTDEQRLAIKYIHGEGEDYGEERVMNELGAFCHACDVISSRIYHSQKDLYN